MLHILVVCTGNTCRSPMAEMLLKDTIRRQGLQDKITVHSAGLAAGGQVPASPHAHTVMRERGLDVSGHRSRQLTLADLDGADLVLTMTAAHKHAILQRRPEAADKVFTLAEFAGQPGDITDPFGGTVQDYHACAQQLEQLIAKAWQKIVGLAGESHNS